MTPDQNISPLAISVVIPRVGRPSMLRDTLVSLARCAPAPAEVIIVGHSADTLNDPVVQEVGLPGARVIASSFKGRGSACNLGLLERAIAAS